MSKKLIVISGNLGAGKTTLARAIGTKLHWHIGYESVRDNPYLVDFYKDMNKWAYHLQIYFLGYRIDQLTAIKQQPLSAVLDRSIYEDAFIFAKTLFEQGYIQERDYNAYLKLFDIVVKNITPPNLLIYVKAPLEILQARIIQRGQDFDKTLSLEYLEMIESQYLKWINDFKICPVLTIDSGKLDYLNNENDLNIILEQIKIIL